MSLSRVENEKQWQEHVRLASEHEDGVTSYCRTAGISVKGLGYWRKKFERKPRTNPHQRSAFIPVQVLASEDAVSSLGRERPDAKWVADIILHLSAGFPVGRR